MFKVVFFIVAITWCIIVSAQSTIAPERMNISVAIHQTSYKKYKSFMDTNFCDKLPDPTIVQMDRNLLEFYFICMAVKHEGVILDVEFVPSPSYARSLQMVRSGRVHTVTQTAWKVDIDKDKFYSSDAIMRSGEFEKGIYVSQNHPLRQFSAKDIDLSKYIGLTSSNWFLDVAVIKTLTDRVYFTRSIRPQFKMLEMGRADFTMLGFSSIGDLSHTQDGIKLSPLIGVKTVIPESRHFVVSQNKEDSKYLLKLLSRGLMKLRKNNEILELYQKAGVINSRVKDWKILNADSKPSTSSTDVITPRGFKPEVHRYLSH